MKKVFGLAVFIAVLFISCQKEEPNKKEEPVKKIKEVIINGQSVEKDSLEMPQVKNHLAKISFEYQGNKIVKKTLVEGKHHFEMSLTYLDKSIKVYVKGEKDGFLKLNDNGLVLLDSTLAYNNKNQLIKYDGYHFTWENGNVVNSSKKLDYNSSLPLPIEYKKSNFKYTNYENKNGFFQFVSFDAPYGHFIFFYGLNCGVPTKNLVESVDYNFVSEDDTDKPDNNHHISYDYTLDKDGYIASYKTIAKHQYLDGSGSTSYSIGNKEKIEKELKKVNSIISAINNGTEKEKTYKISDEHNLNNGTFEKTTTISSEKTIINGEQKVRKVYEDKYTLIYKKGSEIAYIRLNIKETDKKYITKVEKTDFQIIYE